MQISSKVNRRQEP